MKTFRHMADSSNIVKEFPIADKAKEILADSLFSTVHRVTFQLSPFILKEERTFIGWQILQLRKAIQEETEISLDIHGSLSHRTTVFNTIKAFCDRV